MKNTVTIDNWQLAWIENATVNKNGIVLKTPQDVLEGNYKTIKASVPGLYERGLAR